MLKTPILRKIIESETRLTACEKIARRFNILLIFISFLAITIIAGSRQNSPLQFLAILSGGSIIYGIWIRFPHMLWNLTLPEDQKIIDGLLNKFKLTLLLLFTALFLTIFATASLQKELTDDNNQTPTPALTNIIMPPTGTATLAREPTIEVPTHTPSPIPATEIPTMGARELSIVDDNDATFDDYVLREAPGGYPVPSDGSILRVEAGQDFPVFSQFEAVNTLWYCILFDNDTRITGWVNSNVVDENTTPDSIPTQGKCEYSP